MCGHASYQIAGLYQSTISWCLEFPLSSALQPLHLQIYLKMTAKHHDRSEPPLPSSLARIWKMASWFSWDIQCLMFDYKSSAWQFVYAIPLFGSGMPSWPENETPLGTKDVDIRSPSFFVWGKVLNLVPVHENLRRLLSDNVQCPWVCLCCAFHGNYLSG